MQFELEPGTYVVAVSGGVDSMAMLDLLVKKSKVESRKSKANGAQDLKTFDFATFDPMNRYRFIVAHFDHGIREDSHLDRQLVGDVARGHGLPFVSHRVNLGKGSSEARARQARYEFLHGVRQAARAKAVLTAHHEDDLMETAVLNLLRGTGRKGFSSMGSQGHVLRPLLHIPKRELLAYAVLHGLRWREDSTNQDMKLRRNYVRHKLLNKLSKEQKQELMGHVRRVAELNREIDQHIDNHLHAHPGTHELDRLTFIHLPHKVALETLASWLRHRGIRGFNRKRLEQLVVAAKTYHPGKTAKVDKGHTLKVGSKNLALVSSDR